jgi:hypothetical protein
MAKKQYWTRIEVAVRTQDPTPEVLALRYGEDRITEVGKTDLFRVLAIIKQGVFGMADLDFFYGLRLAHMVSDWNYREATQEENGWTMCEAFGQGDSILHMKRNIRVWWDEDQACSNVHSYHAQGESLDLDCWDQEELELLVPGSQERCWTPFRESNNPIDEDPRFRLN